MCEWLCDFCPIHRLGIPADILSPALDDIVEISRMKEFYLSAAVGGKGTDAPDLAGARILLQHCCQYDYRKSKFAGGENAALFDRIIPGAVAAVLPLLLGQDGKPPLITMQDSTVTRDAYTGALCAYRNKRRLVVSYTSFSRSHELRFPIRGYGQAYREPPAPVYRRAFPALGHDSAGVRPGSAGCIPGSVASRAGGCTKAQGGAAASGV